MFSVTLSVRSGCCPGDPRLTQGTVPYGVRTFLSAMLSHIGAAA